MTSLARKKHLKLVIKSGRIYKVKLNSVMYKKSEPRGSLFLVQELIFLKEDSFEKTGTFGSR